MSLPALHTAWARSAACLHKPLPFAHHTDASVIHVSQFLMAQTKKKKKGKERAEPSSEESGDESSDPESES